ncbi:LmeA family phospholipid-binding protein [Microbacterium sp. No. 7]|uniref:LmeA family phospholipid-binding protein n=1 Tax=Microbacterium sp. No. 7 TaxID=1714373 RepID=UPI0006D11DDB|nr:DUF2993 domain-containing protein [Microbacterium sp. No. 7]ALJ21210.1 hypothetical protein AOA12_15395 [Microbacterium sp. No. 7]
MSDAHPTQPLPPAAVPSARSSSAALRRRRRRRRLWPWVAVVLVLLLLVAGWFIAEPIVRGMVVDTVRTETIKALDLPADQQLDVELEGQVLPQLIMGRLDALTVSSDEVTLGPLTGAVVVHGTGIPIRGGGAADTASATLRLNEQQVRDLLATVEGLPAATVTLDEPVVRFETELQVLVTVPVGVSLRPSAVGGDLVLTPDSLRVGGADIPAQALVDQFGAIARTVVRDWDVCIAQYLPAGVTLDRVEVKGKEIVADAVIDGRIVSDPTLQDNGVCD